MTDLILALDQGTTSSRSILFTEKAEIRAVASEPLECRYPDSGWVEQDAEAIWETQRSTIVKVLDQAGIGLSEVSAIGITNQRESTIAWNRETGEALCPAINWQCRRTAGFCDELKEEGFDELIRNRTGLVTDPYFSGTKMHWILQNVPEAANLARQGKLCFGTVDSWLIWKLSGGTTHAIEISNASRTLVFDIQKCEWDSQILSRFGIPPGSLPEVVPSSGVIAEVDESLFGGSAPIAGAAGDQQAALFGQACFTPGMAKNTYGTGCFMISNTGKHLVRSQNGLLTTIGWKLGDEVTYALEGSVFIAGALVQWLRDGLELFSDAAETESIALSVSDSGGVFVVPAFVGLGAPHWDPYARGLMVGLTRDTRRSHIVRASLEAIAFQSAEVLNSISQDTSESLNELRIDGGAAANQFLCQFQADLLGLDVRRPQILETTAMGAAFLAGLAVGTWSDQQVLSDLWKEEKTFRSSIDRNTADAKMKEWLRAVERSKAWIQ